MKKNSPILFFFLSVFVSVFLIFKPLHAQTSSAGLLPPGVQQFFDNNGNPLSSGKVYFYEVGTTTFKDVYNSSSATTTYTNPITLNAGGKPPGGSGIYGIGLYRQLVKDRNGNTIWDAVTSPTGSGGTTPTDVGDGNLVGTVLPWSSLVAPNQYVFAYGQEISRTTYPEFYTAITLQSNVICSATSNTLTGLADTSQIPLGSPVELALCVPAGTTVVSKTTSTVTLSNPSSVSINAVAVFFPWGNGNGTTTFNVPDLRGYVVAGRNNMGGTASSRLTTTYYLNSPDGLGAAGGSQSHTQTISEMAMHNHSITDPGHAHTYSIRQNGTNVGGDTIPISGNGSGTIIFPLVASTTTGITQANLTGLSTPFTIIQPTITLNYIIKVTPDTSTSIATGVYSIGGMSGVISCGTGILCTGNFISFNGNVIAGGSDGSIQYRNSDGSFGGSPNLIFTSPDTLTFGSTGITAKFDIYGSVSGRVRQIASAVAGTTNITWGNSSGTPGVTASAPIILNTTTGDISCPTCATGTLNGQALTKTDDTNITLTLGGSPTTALLSPTSLTLGWTGTLAASRLNSNVVQSITNDTNVTGSITAQNLTLGWTGQLGLTRGGTNNSLTASNGGIVWSDASKLNILSGTATANLPLLSGSTATPSWASIAYPTNLISGGVLYGASTSQISSSALLGANQLMIGGGAGSAPSTFACATITTVVHGGTPPTCSQIVAEDITTNTITNSNLSQVSAATIKGNPTASTANVQDFTFSSLTQTVSPGALDWIPIYDNATGTIKKVNANSIASASVAGVATLNGLSGALTIVNGQAIQSIDASGTTITISADVATVSDFETGTANKLLDANIVFTPETTTTYGTTTSFDFNTFINTKVTLTGNITTMNCSNMKAGQAGTIAFIQDSTGSRTAAFNTGTCSTTLKFANATFPTLTTSASAIDILSYSCRNSTYCAAALSKGYNP